MASHDNSKARLLDSEERGKSAHYRNEWIHMNLDSEQSNELLDWQSDLIVTNSGNFISLLCEIRRWIW